MKMVEELLKSEKGQGLLESMIAVTFISAGVLAALTLVLSNIRASDASINQLQAFNMALEGVEVVRSIRDSNFLDNDSDWDLGIAGPSGDNTAIAVFDFDNNAWSMDYSPNTIIQDEETRILQRGRVFFQSSAGDPAAIETPFYRLIKTIPDGPSKIEIISEVRWFESGGLRSVKAEEWIYDWK